MLLDSPVKTTSILETGGLFLGGEGNTIDTAATWPGSFSSGVLDTALFSWYLVAPEL